MRIGHGALSRHWLRASLLCHPQSRGPAHDGGGRGSLGQLDRHAVGILDVDVTPPAPVARGDGDRLRRPRWNTGRAQPLDESVEVGRLEADVNRSGVAGPRPDRGAERLEILEDLEHPTARDCELCPCEPHRPKPDDPVEMWSCDLAAAYHLQLEQVVPECERPLHVRGRDADVMLTKNRHQTAPIRLCAAVAIDSAPGSNASSRALFAGSGTSGACRANRGAPGPRRSVIDAMTSPPMP